MNFLAHLLLAPPHPHAWAGSIFPDLAAPRARRDLSSFPPLMVAAIGQHLAIDAYTDTHPLVTRSKNRFRSVRKPYDRYVGILVDVFYDHILACDWPRYHPQPLPAFIAQIHDAFRTHTHLLPESMRYPIDRLIAQDWLACYATMPGLDLVLSLMSKRMAQRFDRPVDLPAALPDLLACREGLREDFHAFFPQLIAHAQAVPGIAQSLPFPVLSFQPATPCLPPVKIG